MKRIICGVVGHRRDGGRVRSDGYNYRAPCRRCGTPMMKEILGVWRPVDSLRDDDVAGITGTWRPTPR